MWRQEFAGRYAGPAAVPVELRPRLQQLDASIRAMTDQAFALGWRFPQQSSEKQYLDSVSRRKAEEGVAR